MNPVLLFICSALAATLSMALFRQVLHGRIIWRGDFLLLVRDTLALLGQPLFLLAVAAFGIATALWLVVLATQKFSVAYPVQIGMVTILTGLVSALVFRENIPVQGYIGYGLLLAGVVLIFR
jgi:multidrug transporter EmrE-like cation transporter